MKDIIFIVYYGSYWHVDHIRPMSWFDTTNFNEFTLCWSLDNLQPLEAVKNRMKSNRYIG